MINQIETLLDYPFLYKWKQEGDISILSNSDAGYYFRLFQSISSEQEALKLLKITEGNFAVVINSDHYFLAAVDRIRSFPLFCKIADHKIFVTDDIASREQKFIFNEKAINTFKKIFCTEGSETLLEDWKQIQPGEFLFINKLTGDFSITRYFTFRPQMPSLHINYTELREIFLDVFRNILDKIGDKPIVVPLSSGYDSRCIVAILSELNARNIFAYTYGTRHSFEKEIAQKVTQELNVNWHFIEYTDDLMKSFFDKKWEYFSSKNHHFTSLPVEQDFFALLTLSENKLLPENGVVLSGYLGDYFAGNKIRFEGTPKNEEDQLEYLYLNRGSKFVVNSIRLYEYFGLEWFIPFGANPILNYIFHVPIHERKIENGYNNFLSEAFFKPLNIDFKKQDHYYQSHHFKNFLKKNLPQGVVKLVQYKKSLNQINDPNNTNYIRDQLYKIFYSGQKKYAKPGFNEMYAEYFVHRLKDSLKPKP